MKGLIEKRVSIMLVLVLLIGLFAATPLTVYADDQNFDGYDDGDVAVINRIIAENGLGWAQNDPVNWPVPKSNVVSGVGWDADGRIVSLVVADLGLTGSMNLTGLTSLQELNCERNAISVLDISNNPSLTFLWCGGNQLTSLDVSHNPAILSLRCDNNYMPQTEGSGVVGIENLSYFDSWGSGNVSFVYSPQKVSHGDRYYEIEIDGKWFLYDDGDRTRVDGFWEFEDGRIAYYDGANGRVTGPKNIDGSFYYFDPASSAAGNMWTGWRIAGSDRYYYDENGHLVFGAQTIDGKWYYFNSVNGKMTTGAVADGGNFYYVNPDGSLYTGWREQNGRQYYYNEDGHLTFGFTELDGLTYYFNPASAVLSTGAMKIGSAFYYFDPASDPAGKMWTGWRTVGGDTYYYDAAGHLVFGYQVIDGEEYYFNTGDAKLVA